MVQAIFDFLVLILFFATYIASKNIYTATTVGLIAGVLNVAINWRLQGKIGQSQLATLVVLIISSSATLLLRNPIWIQWKPTLIDWAIAIASTYAFFNKSFLGKVIDQNTLAIPQPILQQLAGAWAIYFIGMGVLNILVAYHCTLDQWIIFKTFITLGLSLIFFMVQFLYVYLRLKKGNKD